MYSPSKRRDEEDDVDVDVEFDGNDSNIVVDDFVPTSSSPSSYLQKDLPTQEPSKNMIVDDYAVNKPEFEHSQDVDILASEPISDQISQNTGMEVQKPEIKSTPSKPKGELDFELETKYSKIWGELKVHFTNRHFLKPEVALAQHHPKYANSRPYLQQSHSIGGFTFYATETPIIDNFLGMEYGDN